MSALIYTPVYLSLACYLIAVGLTACGGNTARFRAAARWFWTIGAAALLLHVAAAFHGAHHWSHAAALAHTARQTEAVIGWNWGGGLWLNYLLTFAWVVDAAAWWWMGHERHARLALWLGIGMHAFLAFMWINAAVIFAHGPSRWVALVGFVLVAMVLLVGRAKQRPIP